MYAVMRVCICVCRTKPLPFNVAVFGFSVLKLFTMLARLVDSNFGLCFASLTNIVGWRGLQAKPPVGVVAVANLAIVVGLL